MVITCAPLSAMALTTGQGANPDGRGPGYYLPDVKLKFGTLVDESSEDWTTNVFDDLGGLGEITGYGGLFGPEVDYNYTNELEGMVSGYLTLPADRANTVAENIGNGYAEMTEDYTYGVGDVFTATIVIDNIDAITVLSGYLEYSDNIEPYGAVQYSKKNGTKWKNNLKGWFTNKEYQAMVADTDNYKNVTWKTAGLTDIRDQSVSKTGVNQDYVVSDDDQNSDIGLQKDHLMWLSMAIAEHSCAYEDQYKDEFIDPDTLEQGYGYSDCAVIATFAFKIVDEGPITFKPYRYPSLDVYKKDIGFSDFFLFDLKEGSSPEYYTTYYPDLYNDKTKLNNGDVEWPGSRLVTIFGRNYDQRNDVSGGEDTKTYNVTFTNAAGEVVSTQTIDEGKTATLPDNTASTVTKASATTHTTTTYKWPAAASEAITADSAFVEESSTATDNCTFKSSVITAPTYTSTGLTRYTCDVCGNTYDEITDKVACSHPASALVTQNAKAATLVSEGYTGDTYCTQCETTVSTGETIAKLDGTAYYAALSEAKAIDGSAYTADSYKAVTEAIAAYDTAIVEAYTSQGDVDAATAALKAAVAGLEALPTTDVYTYTFADGSTKDVTVAKGQAPTAPDNTASTVKANTNKTHTTTSYTWSKTGDYSYSEVASTKDDACTLAYAETKAATIAAAGEKSATCPVCNATYTEATAKLDGDDYYAALAAAKAITADGYTAQSYADVQAAIKAYDTAIVEAYTDQASVDEAALALQSAVSALVKEYTITFVNNAGVTVDTQTVAEGTVAKTPDNTAATAIKSDNNASTHSHVTYSWPTVAAATADATYKEVATTVTDKCTAGTPVVVEPTLDKAGSSTTSCTICGQVLETTVIPALEGVSITVKATDLGTTTINGADATNGATVKVVKDSDYTLTAAPVDGATFVGWNVNGMLVSKDATYTTTAIIDTTVEPVYTSTVDNSFTVVFTDAYGNIVGDPQTVTSGADIVIPAGPVLAGSTFAGWSLTNDEIAALTAGATITAKYEKDASALYTVTAKGATITANDADTADTAADIAYDTKVTVTAPGATVWYVDGAAVGYGESYTFFCGSNITLTYATEAVTATPTVSAVDDTAVNGTYKVAFLATRSIPDGYTYINSGFVYGKNLTDADLDIANVGKTGSNANSGVVKVAYAPNTSDQFCLNYGVKAMNAPATAKAFVSYKDANGEVKTIYATAQIHNY